MRSISSRLILLCSVLLLSSVSGTGQGLSSAETVKLLPRTVGDFRSQASRPLPSLSREMAPDDLRVRGAAEGTYLSPKGERLTVLVITTPAHAGAYSLLTRVATQMKSESEQQVKKLRDVGVAGIASADRVAFYEGPVFVSVSGKTRATSNGENSLLAFARAYARTLPAAEKEIPVLVKHLPDWETAQDRAIYSLGRQALEEATGQQLIFEEVNFNQGAEAVTATYDSSRLVIVEFTTPQLAAEADARITARLQELRKQEQPTPLSYRRVGNYSVFVLNAPNETTAAQLIDRVKYEQSIQWLGENPLLWARAEKQHTREAVSLILGIARTIGFFVVICLGFGGVVGGTFFLLRRAQRRAVAESYTDAGGMLRLNLDEIPLQTDPARLVGAGDEKPVVP